MTLADLANLATVATALIAAGAIILAIYQTRWSRTQQIESVARDHYQLYLRLCIDYPKFATPSSAQLDIPKATFDGKKDTFTSYLWFLWSGLNALEGMYFALGKKESWRNTIACILDEHAAMLSSSYVTAFANTFEPGFFRIHSKMGVSRRADTNGRREDMREGTMNRLLTMLIGVMLAGCVNFSAHADSTSDANKAMVLAFMKMLFVDHKVDQAIDTYVDPGYIQHNPIAATGSEAIRGFFKGFYANSPGATIEIKRALADGDLVAVHYRANFTGKPDDRGLAVVDIFRIAHGKIVEHWDVGQPVPEKSANDNGMF